MKKSLLKFLSEGSCGERGIRTPGTSRYDGFQDRCNRPLYHLSKFGRMTIAWFSQAGAKVRLFFDSTKFLGIFFRKILVFAFL